MAAVDIGDQHLRCHRGDDWPIRLTMVPPTNVAGWTLAFTVKRKSDGVDGEPLVLKTTGAGIALVSEATGVWDITLASADTDDADVGAGQYLFDVRRTNPGNNRAIARGTLTVLETTGLRQPEDIEAADTLELVDAGTVLAS